MAATAAQSERDQDGTGPWWVWQAVTAAATLALLGFIALVAPRFFFRGDKAQQYLPVAADIGRRIRAGEWLPTIDPALGQSGNYALDLQYGLFEPTHLLVAVAMSMGDNALVASWLWSAAYLLIAACGVCALLQRLGVAGSWAATCGVAAALSGFTLFWLSPSWMPGLGVAWVPWWWWAVAARRVRPAGLVAVAAFTFLICAGGWPATWLVWFCVVGGVVVETLVSPQLAQQWRGRLLQLLATAGGGVAATVTVLPLARSVDYTNRTTEWLNNGFLVPNLADLLAFAAPGLHPDIRGFGSYSLGAPVFFGVWFALVVAWLTPWRRDLLRRPGVVACLVALAASMVLTQSASEMGPLRWPIRVLPGFHLFLAVGAGLLVGQGRLVLTRRRVGGVLLSALLVGLLTFFRKPVDTEWATSTGLLLAAIAALLLAVHLLGTRLAALVALLATLVLTGWAVNGHPTEGPGDDLYPAHRGTVDRHREPTLVLYPRRPAEAKRWYRQGVAVGFARLSEQDRAQPGYSSVSQIGWRTRFCMNAANGLTCPNAATKLFATHPGTGLPWIDLLGYREVVVHNEKHLERWLAAYDRSTWTRTDTSTHFVTFTRTQALDNPGRVTAVVDGTAEISEVAVSKQSQSYEVQSDDGARVVFRDFFWPGYRATLDGERAPVRPVSRTLVSVLLPPGADGTLQVTYVALPTLWWVGLGGAGLLLVSVAAGLAVLLGRREDDEALSSPDAGGERTPPGASPGS